MYQSGALDMEILSGSDGNPSHSLNYRKSGKIFLKKVLQSLCLQEIEAPHKTAADRNRTGTGITTHGILSPGRLPVPPLRHMEPIGLEPMTLCL